MKKSTFKSLFIASLAFMSSGVAFAQTTHPLAFPAAAGGKSNFYADYVGLRFEVTAPSAIAGDKVHTDANSGTGATGDWGGFVSTPIVNAIVAMGPTSDTNGCATLPAGSMTGKIALIYRGICEFGFKALQAQNAGAIACVIVNNVGGGPVGMAAGASGAADTIPIFMISNADGIAITEQINAGNPVTMTITPWGFGNTNDLGFVSGGTSNWHDYAIPSNQLTSTASQAPYKGIDGAFVANFGSSDQTNVTLSTKVQFTPAAGGTATTVHSDSIVLASFPEVDSIWAMYAPAMYDVPNSGNGRYDITYNITSDATDDYLGDNTVTSSFYTTDSLYSKSRYDFTLNQPIATIYEQPGFTTPSPYIWGPMYYVANGGSQIQNVQFTVAAPTAGVITSAEDVPVFIFQWQDGSNGEPADSVIQNNELILLGTAFKVFDGLVDSSEEMFTVAATDSDGNPKSIITQSNSWYFLGVEVPAGWFLGLDGVADAYPRTYGRFNNAAGYLEYAQGLWGGDRGPGGTNSMLDFGDDSYAPCPFSGTTFINSIDSVNYGNEKGIVPSVAMIVNNHPSAIKNVSAPIADVKLFPNPATDYLTVSADFSAPAKSVTYTIIDGMARFVSKETHTNVQNDKYTFSTANLPSGTYYVSIIADNKSMSRKFTVIR